MSIRTTVTLDEDVVERLKEESRATGVAFRKMLNDMVRLGLLTAKSRPKRKPFKVVPLNVGFRPDLNYDCIGQLLEELEGPDYR